VVWRFLERSDLFENRLDSRRLGSRCPPSGCEPIPCTPKTGSENFDHAAVGLDGLADRDQGFPEALLDHREVAASAAQRVFLVAPWNLEVSHVLEGFECLVEIG
jgi:hypothetical protein